MTTPMLRPRRLHSLTAGCALALATLAAGISPLPAQSIACMVNGEPITGLDIEQRTKLNFLTTRKQSTKQEILDELINDKVKIKEAKRYGVDPGASDMDQAFAGMAQRMRLTPDQLSKSLESQGVRPETLKARLKSEMVWGSLVRGRFKESLQVGEKDVATAAQQGGESTQVDAFEYRLQPIVLIVPRGSAQGAIDQRRKEAETLRERVQSCDQANDFFKSMQNAAIRPAVTKTSADIPGPLRELLDKTPVGRLTPPEITKQGVEMVALCERKPTKIDTPKKREIREKMYTQKYEAKSKSYLADIRKAAMIECR
ncbi:SurA N-terminal domain-containing protein [Bradyrhizobium sp. CB3481]|uniref:SurA N-terminal domain-containing protein n=1 Tax=Bradyrhizobium sp. CB3481 TaxID=3039158 RepID=UPI0024B0799D|nr:SurA N-terminal domain-containing protein [Bradyrhizobium sp. CB3481]WFU14025.1 SurA N-terminal domain-containing protein [Bradyrhizobium sp. CB3481]